MRPAQEKKSSPVARPSTAGSWAPSAPDAPPSPFAERKPLKPIGPAALKNLREAIRSGQYPSDAAVRAGIERLLRRGE